MLAWIQQFLLELPGPTWEAVVRRPFSALSALSAKYLCTLCTLCTVCTVCSLMHSKWNMVGIRQARVFGHGIAPYDENMQMSNLNTEPHITSMTQPSHWGT
ncbi:hypothetical protein AOQ84DRAFT_357834 [Glonium stellatum]|uniref:Uncharacterized protein n=1 Tax=Glonium stellatum TaxID=574774 RepID=A0A8E2EN38_9PEZI|nr:hypothetical protein AOQ84DRAFT_357834 [Glonium stellatum]